jgi:hypothetical protein
MKSPQKVLVLGKAWTAPTPRPGAFWGAHPVSGTHAGISGKTDGEAVMTDRNLMEYLDELALEYSVTLLTRDKADLVGISITLAHHLGGGYCLNTVHDL